MSEILSEPIETEKDWIDHWVDHREAYAQAWYERKGTWVELTDSSFEIAESSSLNNLARFCKKALAHFRASWKVKKLVSERPGIYFDWDAPSGEYNKEEWAKMVRVGIVEIPMAPPPLASDLADSNTIEFPFF